MRLLSLRNLCSLLLMTVCLCSVSQTRGVIIDKETHRPIPGVSIYVDGIEPALVSMSSDAFGRISVPAVKKVRLSHTSYDPVEIMVKDIRDTIFLTQKNVQLPEVVVVGRESEWVKRALWRFLEQRGNNYLTKELKRSYDYASLTYGENDSCGDYSYESQGNIIFYPLESRELPRISTHENVVYSRDSTSTGDFANLRRMIHEDMVNDIDKRFIKEHQYWHNEDYVVDNPSIVQIRFRSKKFNSDEGYLVMDTLKNVILEGYRATGRDYNTRRLISATARNAMSLLGLRYTDFNIRKHYHYSPVDGILYPHESSCLVKMTKTWKDKQWTTETQASVRYRDSIYNTDEDYAKLYEIYYFKIIGTQKDADRDDSVNDLPFKFVNPYVIAD